MKERFLSKTPFLIFVYLSKCNMNKSALHFRIFQKKFFMNRSTIQLLSNEYLRTFFTVHDAIKKIEVLVVFSTWQKWFVVVHFQPRLLVLTLSEDRELFIKEHKQLGNNAGQDPLQCSPQTKSSLLVFWPPEVWSYRMENVKQATIQLYQ